MDSVYADVRLHPSTENERFSYPEKHRELANSPEHRGSSGTRGPALPELIHRADRQSGHQAGRRLSVGSTLRLVLLKTVAAQPLCPAWQSRGRCQALARLVAVDEGKSVTWAPTLHGAAATDAHGKRPLPGFRAAFLPQTSVRSPAPVHVECPSTVLNRLWSPSLASAGCLRTTGHQGTRGFMGNTCLLSGGQNLSSC